MNYDWKIFEHGPVEAPGGRIRVSLNPRGNIFLNGKAVEALGQADAVVLMYDSRRSVIGLQRAPLDRPNAFRLKRKARGYEGRLVYAANFCRANSICPDETLRFAAPVVNKDGILLLDLNDVVSVKKR
jgi:hypothetical protein